MDKNKELKQELEITEEPIEINGKVYPLWSQFVQQKDKWVGKTLEDFGDSMDRGGFGAQSMTTTIIDITLLPNGDKSAYFSVDGEAFGCGFDVKYGGVSAGEEGWITFGGTWGINGG